MTTASQERFPIYEFLGIATGMLEEIEPVMHHAPLFEGFNHSDLVGVLRHMKCYRAPAGSEVIREGDPGEFAILLISGSIEILRRCNNGIPQRISIVRAGNTLGEMALVDGEARFASCVSMEPIVFAMLDRENLQKILSDEPHLGIKMLSSLLCLLNQRLRDTGRRLVEALAH